MSPGPYSFIGQSARISRFGRIVWVLCLSVSVGVVAAATYPKLSEDDPRIGFVDYKPHDVVVIASAMGVVTRIILADDEKITRADLGFASSCEDTTTEWCVRAELGHNQITIKPKRLATQNNLEISTDKRDYSFALHAMPGAEKSKTVFYRVVFRYPMPRLPAAHVRLLPVEVASQGALTPSAAPAPSALTAQTSSQNATGQQLARPQVRNTSYSFKGADKAAGILPSVIFDDGRFTYLQFPKASEVPAVFAVDGSGNEVRVAFHADRLLGDKERPQAQVESDYLVIRRVASAFTLRLGDLVAQVINDNYDPQGVETYNGTTTPTLRREAKP